MRIPRTILPSAIFPLGIRVPCSLDARRILNSNDGNNLGINTIIILPRNFGLTPTSHVPRSLTRRINDACFVPCDSARRGVLLTNPLPKRRCRRVVFPVLSPSPTAGGSITFNGCRVRINNGQNQNRICPAKRGDGGGTIGTSISNAIANVRTRTTNNCTIAVLTSSNDSIARAVPTNPRLVISRNSIMSTNGPLADGPGINNFNRVSARVILRDPGHVGNLVTFITTIVLARVVLILGGGRIRHIRTTRVDFWNPLAVDRKNTPTPLFC